MTARELRHRTTATAEAAGSPVVEVRNLTKRYGQVTAVNNLSFTVAAGRVTGFLGPNGSGKSTTLRTVLGLIAPTSGSATVLGRPFRQLANPMHLVGAALEATAFHPGRTARQQLGIFAVAAGLPRSRVDEVLDEVGLDEAADRRAGGFSLGMGQRLALAAALLGRPDLLVLDEPSTGLDPDGMRWLRSFLRRFAGDGGTVLLSSHALGEVAQTVDDVVIVNHGELVTAGPLSHLDRFTDTRIRVRSPEASRLRHLLTAHGVAVEADGRDQLLATIASDALGRLALEHNVVLTEMATESKTLEDVFLELTRDNPIERATS
jgi:ABC-2 type transport system ATP-binding protein